MKILDFLKNKLSALNLKDKITNSGLKDKLTSLDLKEKLLGLKKYYIPLTILVLIVMLILAKSIGNIQRFLFKRAPKEAIELEMIGEAVPVKVYRVKRMEFKDTLPLMGDIKGFQEINLKFETSGILESFNFEEGERIQEGDIIANLNQKEALLKLKYAEIELQKTQKLFDIGAIIQAKLDQTRLEYESAKRDLEKTNIYAIADGILGAKDVDIGAYVTPNDTVGTFIEIGNVYAEFNVIERDVPKLRLGQKVEVFVDAYPNRSFKGTVDTISPLIEGRTRTQRIRIELRNPETDLKPGMFVRGLVATYEKKNALIIPTSAFKKIENEYVVFVVQKDEPKEEPEEEPKKKRRREEPEEEMPAAETGTVEIRKIDIGYLTQDLAEIDSGLEEGELIIVEVFQEFRDKDRVELTEIQETLF